MNFKKILLISCCAVFLISCDNSQNTNKDLDDIEQVFKQFMQASVDKDGEKLYQLAQISQYSSKTKVDDAQLKQQLGNFLSGLSDEEAQEMLKMKINRILLTINRVENSDRYNACVFFSLGDEDDYVEHITFAKVKEQWKVILIHEDKGYFSINDDHGYCR